MGETARAAVFTAAKAPFEIREYPIPDPRDRDAVIAVTRANVCGSDVHIWSGDAGLAQMGVGYGIILGHEMVGRVAKLGAKVSKDAAGKRLREGDRVVFTYYIYCGSCPACLRGQVHACMMALASPVRSCDAPPHFFGGFADYYYLKAKQRVFKVPDGLDDTVVAGANCALSQVLHGLDTVDLKLGETVVVQGLGGLGLYACAVARERGASLVIGIDSVPERLEMAKQFGAHEVIDMNELDNRARVSRVQRLTGGWGADVVVEVAGVPEAIPEGIRMTARLGRYLEMGCINPKRTYKADPSLLVGFNRSIHGVSLYPPQTLGRAVAFLERTRARYPYEALVSHDYTLDQIDEAFAATGHGCAHSGSTRAAIVMHGEEDQA